MKDKFVKSDVLIFLLAILGLVVFVMIYPRLYPESALRMDVEREEIIRTGISFIEDMGHNLGASRLSVKLEHDKDQLRYLNKTFGSERTNILISDSISVFYWVLRWMREKDESISVTIGSDNETDKLKQVYEYIQLLIDLKGKPFRFDTKLRQVEQQSTYEEFKISKEMDRIEAEKLLSKLIEMYGETYYFEGYKEINNRRGVAREFKWNREGRTAGEDVSLIINVQNGSVQSFQKVYTIPETHIDEKRENVLEGFAVAVVVLLLFVLGVIYFIKRLRSDLLDLKSGLIPGILVVLGWFVNMLVQVHFISGEPVWEMAVGFLITAPFIGGGIWALFTLGESLTREVWVEKLATLDTLRRRILFPEFGLALFKGLALVFIGTGLISVMNYWGVNELRGYFTLGNSPLYLWISRWPSLYAVSRSLLSSLYIVITFCLFFLTLLRHRFRRTVWILILFCILWSFVSFPLPRVQPFVYRMCINGLLGLLFAVFFIRYDFITVTTGAIGIPIFFHGIAALSIGNGLMAIHGFILIGILGSVVLLAVLAYRGESISKEIVTYVPDYMQRIYEKERIQRELEIARHVQLSFLPKRNPEIKGLEIASFCLPAKEVGGDYYDFIEIDPRKMGVVIGDVSGKGISAAFYMTLTKGLLKSQARGFYSPREVLINMNELFYENAERGVFISMIYAIFDLDAMTLVFSRAGHNPMILRRSGQGIAEELCPPGIALGLERGNIFEKTIEEKTIGIKNKDVFLFYTDGLNEAQNQLLKEFSEERLAKIMETYTDLSAEDLLDKIKQEIKYFTAEASQHDDMTAVVVKVL